VAAPRWSLRRARLLVGTKLALVAGLVGFVVFAWIVEKVAGIDHAITLGRPVALAMAAVPAALWLAFFYLFDRHEPEPKQLVAGVCVLGALIAAPLADFTLQVLAPDVALAQHSVSPFSLDRVIYAVFVVGLAQELCKYVTVRYSIYLSPEFDEPMDGVVYMMSCGTGFAVWVNYHRLSSQAQQVFLSSSAAQTVITTLAQASFAGVLGYVLGRAKFTRRSAPVRGILLFFGLLLAAALNGQFQLVELWVRTTEMGASEWRGVAYAALFAGMVFGLLMLASQRLLADSPFRRDR
jgi:RsiW-degrading membrane proteinase PrsW (M82 family)